MKNNPLYGLATSVNRPVQKVKRHLLEMFIVVLVVRTIQEMSEDDATHMAAGVAYYAIFSLFPLLLGLIAILSLFLGSQNVQSEITKFVTSNLPGSEDLVETNITALRGIGGTLTAVAIVGLFWSGSAVFGAVTRAVNRAWDVQKDRPIFVSKPRQLLMALGVGGLFWLSVSMVTFVRFTDRFTNVDYPGVGFLIATIGQLMLQGTSLLLSLAIFLLIYKFLPNTKTYWRYIWPGAILAAVLFEAAKNGFILYLNRFTNFDNVYGTLTPVIVLMLWTYVSSLILILGAELSSEYGRLKRGIDRGTLLHRHEQTSSETDDHVDEHAE